jgi:hypothetical protein
MKTLYIIDYWVPFPSSEYGGVVSVIAGDDQECFDILQKEREEYHSSYDNLIMQSIKDSITIKVFDYEESRIVSSFIT